MICRFACFKVKPSQDKYPYMVELFPGVTVPGSAWMNRPLWPAALRPAWMRREGSVVQLRSISGWWGGGRCGLWELDMCK